MHLFSKCSLAVMAILILSFVAVQQRPTLYIIGDSTVKNSDGSGSNGQWGWGSLVDVFFDTSRIAVRNHAIGGRSSRTFITDGRWDRILQTLQKGDYLIIQFGHNDSSPLDDTARARGTIKGIGSDSIDTYNPIRKQREMVYSYGIYMRRFVNEAKAKGAIPIICSPVPRENWKEGKIVRSDYLQWSKQIAAETGTCFIDLQNMIAQEYEMMDTLQVKQFFPADHTHTNKQGALLNAEQVAKGIRELAHCDLKKFLK